MTISESTIQANQKVQTLAETFAGECCVELFEGSEIPLTGHSGASGTGLSFCAVIGFSGKALRGSLVLGLSGAAMTNLKAFADVPGRDALGELANQLLGRLKNRLLRYDVELFLGIPVVLRGEHFSPLPRHELEPLHFRLGEGDLAVWVEIECSDGFSMRSEPSEAEAALAEGASLMF